MTCRDCPTAWYIPKRPVPPTSPTPETACGKCGHETARHGEMGCTVPTGNYVYETTCPCNVRLVLAQPLEMPE